MHKKVPLMAPWASLGTFWSLSGRPWALFGRSWALTMMREMSLALDDRHVVRALDGEDGKLTSILAKTPDRLMVQFV